MEQKMNPDAIEFAHIIDGMFDLYVKKNKNYGNSFSDTWKDFGIVSGCTRLSDKMNRIKSLVKGNTNNFESLEDTFIDLANYAIMCVIEMRKENGTLETAKDTEALEFKSHVPQISKKILNEDCSEQPNIFDGV